MASGTTTQMQMHQARGRRGGNRGRRGNMGSPRKAAASSGEERQVHTANLESSDGGNVKVTEEITGADVDEVAVCWICAEPVKYYSVSECDHRTCHVCTLRLRALYKKIDCTFCKNPQASVIFTVSSDVPFSSFTPDRIPYKDPKLSIFFETEEMREETFILLRFNCPDPTCDYIATGWNDLKLHVRAIHNKLMCDLCIRAKKVFSHEHTLYSTGQLAIHLPSIPFRLRRQTQKDQKDSFEGGVHPLCEFCRECFFDDDELFSHMRERHEECFICKRNGVRDQYFVNYQSLENHFSSSHHQCTQLECLAQKFVVFNSALDLKAHMVEEHGAAMTSRDKKDARRIPTDFEFEGVGLGRGGRTQRDRDRGPTLLYHNPSSLGSDGARPSGINRRMEGFGAALTVEGGGSTNSNNTTSIGHRPSSTPPPPPIGRDPVAAEKLLGFASRLQFLTPNVVRAVEAAIRSYSASESSARDLISTVWNISDQKLEDTASVVNAILDFLEDEEKRRDLLNSWNGFKIEERRQFPDLIPTGSGTGYAEITSGRVLNAKHSTASRASQQSSRQVWDRVAQAASASLVIAPRPKPPDRFPPLQPPVLPIPGPAPVPAFYQQQRKTPWTSSVVRATSSVPAPAINPSPEPRDNGSVTLGKHRQTPPPKLSSALFPELPTSNTVKQKPPVKGNVSLRNILGDSAPAKSAWGNGSGDGELQQGTATENDRDVEDETIGFPKGKKTKGKQKQTLFTLGTFPT